MKWLLFVLLLVLAVGVIGAAIMPMAAVAGFAAQHVAGLSYQGATGTIWKGRLLGTVYRGQVLGDLSIRLDAGALLSAKAVADVGVARPDLQGATRVSYDVFSGRFSLTGLKIAGQTSAAPILPGRLRSAGGQFTLTAEEITFVGSACRRAVGELWTNALAKANFGRKWVGPELRGPLACRDKEVAIEVAGKAATGEDVAATLLMGLDLSMDFNSHVANATPGAIETLTELGFKPEGGLYRLHQALGRPEAASPAR